MAGASHALSVSDPGAVTATIVDAIAELRLPMSDHVIPPPPPPPSAPPPPPPHPPPQATPPPLWNRDLRILSAPSSSGTGAPSPPPPAPENVARSHPPDPPPHPPPPHYLEPRRLHLNPTPNPLGPSLTAPPSPRGSPPGIEVDGRLQFAASTWFVYGHISSDGEVVVGRYQEPNEGRRGPRRPATLAPPEQARHVTAHVDPVAAHEVAARTSTPRTAPGPRSWRPLTAGLAAESDRMFEHITCPDRPGRVRVAFTTCPRPYANARELIRSVRDDRLLEVVTVAVQRERRHPLMGGQAGGAYDRFRAVHDVLGHARLHVGFDRDGEFAAWRSQDRLHGPLARRALATELHGQHSVCWTTGEMAEPKAVLLDPRLVRRSIPHPSRPLPIRKDHHETRRHRRHRARRLHARRRPPRPWPRGNPRVARHRRQHPHRRRPGRRPRRRLGRRRRLQLTLVRRRRRARVLRDVDAQPPRRRGGRRRRAPRRRLDRRRRPPARQRLPASQGRPGKAIEGSAIPFTIVRSTQFFEFVPRIADGATQGDKVHLPPVGFQPVAAADLATTLARLAVDRPIGGRVEVGRPERFRFDELVQRVLAARGDPRSVVADPDARYSAPGSPTAPSSPRARRILGNTHLDDWLGSTTPPT